MSTPAAAGDTPPADTGHDTAGASPEGGGIELFPINFTSYQHDLLPDLDTETHVRAITDLLAPYGVRTTPWAVSPDERNRQAVEERLGAWKQPAAPGGNTVLYWVGHGSADHLAHHRTPAPIDDGVTPQEIARAIGSRQLHPGNADSWAIVILDACFSKSFARAVHKELFTHYDDAARYLLLSTAAKGYAELGAFAEALGRALHTTFPTQRAIGLSALGRALAGRLSGFVDDLTIDDDRDQLVRLVPTAAASVSAPLDQLAELQAVIDQLPVDEQRHFIPKASGAELGELAWYFHGRTLQRDRILRWLTTATSGALVVTGPAGAGKSALLGHILLHTNNRLRDILIRHGHLQRLPAGTPCPDDPFDLTAHLAGLTPARTLYLVARAAGLTDLADLAADGQPPADLTSRLLAALRARQEPLTLLFDALDEAEQPLVIADQILRPLAALPTVRLIIGTRRSTREGPDQPAPDDTDLLDTLRPRPAEADGGQVVDLQCVEVAQDPEALAGYLRAKLHSAKRRRALDAEDDHIEEAVQRLVVDHSHNGAEPQQFLYARLAAHELLNDPELLADPSPLVGRTHRQLFARALERLHRTNPNYTSLLKALGLAQGRGMPDQDGIWATAANALASVPAQTRASISGLLEDAAPYLALDQEHEQSVYRLAHRTFTEHFATAPDTGQAHAAITTALACHTRESLQQLGAPGATSLPSDISPYIRRHLATHARLGHTAAALNVLADHPDVLDNLDLTSITTNALRHGIASNALPPAIAGTVLLQHHARDTNPDHWPGTVTAWRRWWRRLGTTYIQGTPPPSEPHTHNNAPWPPSLTAGTARARQLHLQLTGHTTEVWSIAAFTAPDGTPRLASAGADRTVRIWNPATGAQLGQPLTGHDGGVGAVAAFTAPDGTVRLATGGINDRTVRIWSPVTGAQLGRSLTGHDDEVRAVAAFAAPDGTARLASASADGTVRIWNPATGAQLGRSLTGHDDEVRAVAAFAAPDGTARLASASADGTVRIWNPATGAQLGQPLICHDGGVSAVAMFTAPDGTPRLATGGDDGTARIWNPATGAQLGQFVTGRTHGVWAVTVFTASLGTPLLASAGADGTVRIWNPATGAQLGRSLTGHDGGVGAVAAFAAPDGTARLASASAGRMVRIWNPATGAQLGRSLTGHDGWVGAVAAFAAPDGTARLASASADGTVRIWNPATGAQLGYFFTGRTHRVRAMTAFTASDGTPRLATGGDDGTARIWNPATGAQLGHFFTGRTHGERAVAVFTAPDGTPRLATAGFDGTVRIWNPATGAQLGQPFIGRIHGVRAMTAFTAPDGTPRLATASGDRTVRIWNPRTRTGHVLPLADETYELGAGHGLLIASTTAGYLVIDVSSIPTNTA
ncbi:hypothetical protein [Kitasatospora griseola]|uniref:hypothetical protein n=1 Tax=Kitasatospora griseola TaxID=2064 RepID=UPI0016712422|nr:hypothetical protein [Kitasatospora griseola]GGR03663.1 hypothetical protein GCM10010195_69120 [Kitasatospora griseola]